MLGGHLFPPALLVGQEFLETGGCKGESLPTKAHQVGILKPRVIEAVLNGGSGPVEDQTVRIVIGDWFFPFNNSEVLYNTGITQRSNVHLTKGSYRGSS